MSPFNDKIKFKYTTLILYHLRRRSSFRRRSGGAKEDVDNSNANVDEVYKGKDIHSFDNPITLDHNTSRRRASSVGSDTVDIESVSPRREAN